MENLPVVSTPYIRESEAGTSEGVVVPVVYGVARVPGAMLFAGDIELFTSAVAAQLAKMKRYGDMTQAYIVAVWYMIAMGKINLKYVYANDKKLVQRSDYSKGSYFNDGTEVDKPALVNGEKWVITRQLDGNIWSSLDFESWSDRSTVITRIERGAHINGQYIIPALSGFAVSTDGTAWSALTAGVPSGQWHALAQGIDGTVVAVGTSGKIATSTDLVTWTQREIGTFTDDFYGVAYSPTYGFVAVGEGGIIVVSTDGVTWAEATDSKTVATDLNDVAWADDYFVAVGQHKFYPPSSQPVVLKSTDADSWTSISTSGINGDFKDVVYAGGQIAISCVNGNYPAFYSIDDLASITKIIFPTSAGTYSHVVFDDPYFRLIKSATEIYSTKAVDGTWAAKSISLSGGSGDLRLVPATTYQNYGFASKLSGISHIYMPGVETAGTDLRVVFNSGNNAPKMTFDIERVLTTSVADDDFYENGLFIGNNPLAVMFDVLTNAQWGLGIDESNLDIISFDDVTDNAFDEDVRNYGINRIVDKKITARSLFNELLEATDVFLYADGGIIYAGTLFTNTATSEGTIEDEDFIEPLQIERQSWQDVPNEFEGEFIDQDANYEKKTISIKNDAAIDMAGGVIKKKKINLGMFISVAAASARLHEIMQRESRPKLTITCVVSSAWEFLRPGDKITIDSEEYGFNKEFRVLSITIPEVASLGVSLDLQECYENLFDLNYADPLAAFGNVPQYQA